MSELNISSNHSIPCYSQPPPDEDSNASQSFWAASSPAENVHASMIPASILSDQELNLTDFDHDQQYYDSLSRIQAPYTFFPEPLNSSDQEQHPPPSNQQARFSQSPGRTPQDQVSQTLDLFEDLIEQDFFAAWPESHSPQPGEIASSAFNLTDPHSQPIMGQSTKKRKAETPSEAKSARPRTSSTPVIKHNGEDADVVDLVGIEDDEQYKDFKAKQQEEKAKQQQKEDSMKPVRLASFECIICMESPTDLVVTHCGHLFCSECLHRSLYAKPEKKVCPVCRTNINVSSVGKGDQRRPHKNGVFALEMKLMTANKMGKQPIKTK